MFCFVVKRKTKNSHTSFSENHNLLIVLELLYKISKRNMRILIFCHGGSTEKITFLVLSIMTRFILTPLLSTLISKSAFGMGNQVLKK